MDFPILVHPASAIIHLRVEVARVPNGIRGLKIVTPRHTSKYVMPCPPWALSQERIIFVMYESEFEEELYSAMDDKV